MKAQVFFFWSRRYVGATIRRPGRGRRWMRQKTLWKDMRKKGEGGGGGSRQTGPCQQKSADTSNLTKYRLKTLRGLSLKKCFRWNVFLWEKFLESVMTDNKAQQSWMTEEWLSKIWGHDLSIQAGKCFPNYLKLFKKNWKCQISIWSVIAKKNLLEVFFILKFKPERMVNIICAAAWSLKNNNSTLNSIDL